MLARLRTGKTGRQAEQSNPEVNKIEMGIQVQLDGTEVAQTSKASKGQQRIDRSENQAKPPRTVSAFSEPGPQSDSAAGKVKNIMGGRECEIEHFVAKESHYTYCHQDGSAQHDIDFCQCASHFFAILQLLRHSSMELRAAYGSGGQAVKSMEACPFGKGCALRL